MIKKKILFIIIASLFISIISASIISNNLKDRYIEKIIISKVDPTESVGLALLQKEFNGNVLPDLLNTFAMSLNREVYAKSNLSCVDLNRINDVLPIVISNNNTLIDITIVSDDLKNLEKCAQFILTKVDEKNIELRKFIDDLLKKSGGIRSNANQKFRARVNIQDVIDGMNMYEKKLIDNTSLEKSDAKDFLKVWLMELIDRNDIQNEIINLEDVKMLDYLKITSNIIEKQEKLSVYALSTGLFFITLIMFIIFFKGINNKKFLRKINDILK